MLRSWLGLDERPVPFSAEERGLGIDAETCVFVRELSLLPMTFIEFPIDVLLESTPVHLAGTREDEVSQFPALSERQEKHAQRMLGRVPELQALRRSLCPRVLEDELFWAIYFLLMDQHLSHLRGDEGVVEPVVAEAPRRCRQYDWNEVLAGRVSSREVYKCLLQRGGIPPERRADMWRRQLCADHHEEDEEVINDDDERSQSSKHLYADLVGANEEQQLRGVREVPELGGGAGEWLEDERTRRVLTGLAGRLGADLWAPQTGRMAYGLMQGGLDEAQVLQSLESLLRHARGTHRSSPAGALSTILLAARPGHVIFWMATLRQLMRLNLPNLYAHMHELDVSVGSWAAQWYLELFPALPLPQILDRWLYGGVQALHHIALASLFCCAASLLRTTSATEWHRAVHSGHARCAPALLRAACGLRLKQRHWTALLSDPDWWPIDQSLGFSPSLASPAPPLPRLPQASPLLVGLCSDPYLFWQSLYASLPIRHSLLRPRLLHQSSSDGRSVRALLAAMEGDGPYVMILSAVASSNEAHFALVLICTNAPNQEDGELSLGVVGTDSQLSVHGWVGPATPRPSLVLQQHDDGDGGGLSTADNAVALDEDLVAGLARPSPTFGLSAPIFAHIASGDTFQCSLIELWVLEE